MRSQSLIYIHGFRSSPLSEKSRAFRQVFPEITLASYDTLHPDYGYRQLDEIVRNAVGHPLLIGSSLGGFWAYQLAKKHALDCVLLNPCMTPERTLKPDIGLVTNMYTGEQDVMDEADLQKYESYRLPGEPENCVVLHEKGDELIPYQESVANFEGKARLILIEGGSHSFEHLASAIREIERLRTDA
ncbi:MAG TPA: YqiA/YcfP family alpha/beta fold hydrolase [Methylophilaceae bacterium]|nr:YqiA/YcfP family alpha/beta fold hydrolase [Methylophilaceae bacterium]